MRVIEVRDDARLREEVRPFILLERDGENFDGRLRLEVDMLTQVDFREAALSQQRDQAVVSELLFQAPAFQAWKTAIVRRFVRSAVDRACFQPR